MPQQRRIILRASAAPLQAGAHIALPPEETHYLRDVLRLEEGAVVCVVCEQSDHPFEAILVSTGTKRGEAAHLQILGPAPLEGHRGREDILLAPLLKGERSDWVVEKATELGAGNIVIFQAERSVVKGSSSLLIKKKERFSRIAEAATLQCRRGTIPAVTVASSLKEALAAQVAPPSPPIGFFCSLQPNALTFRQVTPPGSSAIFVSGPEGDFSPDEQALLDHYHFTALSLGPLVLRAETAAMVSLAMALSAWGVPGESSS